jgi:hypothetical protein
LTGAYAQLTPSGDAYTNTADPTTNYGAKTLLDVESASQTTYIQFDLSSIPSGYTSASITKATLKLYVNSVTTAGSFNVDFVNGSWSEGKITANNAPALGTTIAASVPLTTANKNQYILIDITSALGDWLNGSQANDGIALVGNSPLNATFDSKENTTTSHPAELDIVFAGGGTITGVTTASGSGLIGGGSSGTLNLSLTNTCAAKQILQWSGSAWACASAGTGTITGVTAGTDLTGGGTSGNVTLNLDTTKVPQLSGGNSFIGNQVVNGNLTVLNNGNYQPFLVQSSSTFGTWLELANTSSGHTWNILSAASGNSEGAGNLGITDLTGKSTIWLEGLVVASANVSSGNAVTGKNTTTALYGTGIQGESTAQSGVGVQGSSTSTSCSVEVCAPTGVSGTASGGLPTGVYGSATGSGSVGTSGISDVGTGVTGAATATTGATVGVSGTVNSPSGFGVQGHGPDTGIQGIATSTDFFAAGVWGNATGASGTTRGVYGTSSSSGGIGIHGIGQTGGQFETGSGSEIIGRGLGTTNFRVDDTGKVFADGGYQTGGADFAESFAVRGDRKHYEAGDLLAIDPHGKRRITLSQRPYSKLVAGIYSTKPGLLGSVHSMFDAQLAKEVPLAVVGVVPCKVTTENGPIQPGDLLVTSSTPGHAMKGTQRARMLGAVVGKALESLEEGKGVIQVLVTLQ